MTYDRFFPYKILAHADKLKEIAKGKIPTPIVMHIYPTNACNNDCWFCIMKDEKDNNPATLSKKVLLKSVKECIKNDVKLIHFSGGGEPTLHPALIEAMKLANENGIKVAISTNAGKYIPELVKYADHIRISVNAGTPSTYYKDMKPRTHTFNRVMENTKKYVEDNKNGKCDIGLGFVITPTNYQEVYEFCKEASHAGVKFVHIRPAFLPDDEELKSVIKNVFDQSNLAKELFTNLEIYTVKDKFDGYWTPREYSKCRSTPLIGVLSATGEFIVCQDVFIRFGNLYEKTLKQIWGKKEHKEAMNKIKLEQCPRCVETKINEVIEHCFINDNVRMDLI